MSNFEFKDFSLNCKAEINDTTVAWLYEASGEIQSAVQRNTRVDTGQLKGSWTYKVDDFTGESKIGSPLENAIWEEFGTGQYAVNGNGRQTAWKYKDRHGNWYTTKGKTPSRALQKAYKTLEAKIKRALEDKLRGMR